MAKYTFILIFGLLMAITACERPSPPISARAETSYNLTAYLNEQKQRLQAEKPMVLKSVQTENKPIETIQTNQLDWEKELSVFEQVDLNRPALQDFYTKQEQVLNDSSILIKYNKLEDAEALVTYLQLRLSPENELQQLQAIIQDKNPLFFSKRHVTLQADPQTGNLSSYHIKGVQKLIFGDSLHYEVDANL